MLTHLNPDGARREEELQDCMLKSRRSSISDCMNSSRSIAPAARLPAFPVPNHPSGLKNRRRTGRRGDLPDSQGSLSIQTRLSGESCDESAWVFRRALAARDPAFRRAESESGLTLVVVEHREAVFADQRVPFGCRQVGRNHLLHQFAELGARLPSEFGLCLGRISKK
jgi:hypothetical protein